MVIVFGGVRVSCAPGCGVELGFFVAIGGEVCGQAAEACLPLGIVVCCAAAEANVAVAVEENYWDFINLICGTFLPTIRPTHNITSIEHKRAISFYIT